jgi:hypothetical protein
LARGESGKDANPWPALPALASALEPVQFSHFSPDVTTSLGCFTVPAIKLMTWTCGRVLLWLLENRWNDPSHGGGS